MRHKNEIIADIRTDISPKLRRWIADYKRQYPELRQARLYELEKEFIGLYCAEFGKRPFFTERHVVFEVMLGMESSSIYNERKTIGSFGEKYNTSMDIVWDMIDQGEWKLTFGHEVVKIAHRYTKLSNVPFSEALELVHGRVLKGAKLTSLEKQLEDEAIDRSRQSQRPAEVVEMVREPKPPTEKKARKKAINGASNRKLKKIRTQFFQWIDEELESVPESDRLFVRQRCQEEFKLTVDRFRRNVAQHKENAMALSRKAVVEALETLNLQVPQSGDNLDLTAVKSAYKRQALQYHPDHGGNTDSYIAVTDAFNLIEKIHNQYKGVMP